jgi:hypothetical protein
MTIIFFSMGDNCGFCVKAEKLLKQLIDSGKIHKKSHSEANGKFSGFPAFLNTANGNTHTGLPSSAESLFEKLGYRDGAGMVEDPDPPDPPVPKVTDYYVVDAEFNKNSKYHILVLNNNGYKPDTILAGLIIQDVPIGATTNPVINVYFKSSNIGPGIRRQITTDDKVMFLKDIPRPKGLFPCVPQSVWATSESISSFFIDPKNRKFLLPPTPCKSNSKVFCCPNTDVDVCPDQPFFDAKTIIMISLIALLVIIIISYMMKMYKK